MPSAPICILNDLTMPMLFYSPHNYGPLPPFPPVPPPMPATPMSPAPASALDIPLPMLWPPGNLMFKNKYAPTVLHRYLGIIQAGHDLGPMIPHIQVLPAPNNFFTPLHILFSSRKMAFSTSTVKVGGVFVALGGVIALPPTPMMVCADPMGFPLGEVPTRWLNKVWVGFTWLDFLLGVFTIVANMLIDKLMNGKNKFGKLRDVVKSSRGSLAAAIYKKMFPIQSLSDAGKALSKQVAGNVVGLVSLLATGEGAVSFTLGSSYANVSLSVGRDTQGNWNATVKGQVPMISESASVKEGSGGSMKANVNWGSGGGSVEHSGSGGKVATHNTFHGQTTSQSSSTK